MKERLRAQLLAAVQDLLSQAELSCEGIPPFALDVPRNPEHGDFASNAALLLAKALRRSPRQVAEQLAQVLLRTCDFLAEVEVAGPGFLNFRLGRASWHTLLARILAEGESFGVSRSGEDAAAQVEFVSANPTGPLTLGHGRQAVLGDAIARLLTATGYRVTREYYFNDAGRQMRVLGASVKARYLEELGRAAPPPAACLADAEAEWPTLLGGLPVVFPRDGYQGDYIRDLALQLLEQHGEALIDEPEDGLFRAHAQQCIFGEIRATLTALGIHFDVYYTETSLAENGKTEAVMRALREKDLVYDADGAVWLRATALGLPRDRVLVKRTGESTYLLPDIAYHCEKFRRGFELVVDVQGADHIEQFPYVKEAVSALGFDGGRVELVMHQFVTLTRGGEQVKQSTRRASYVTVDELLSEIGSDVFRFFMIQRKADGHLDFDLDLAAETDWKKNPAYYLQYAHARACSIERKARELGALLPASGRLNAAPLELPEELDLLRKLGEFPEVVAGAAAAREPHHIAYYLRELAGLWHPYVQDGVRHRVLSDDAALSQARLALVAAVRTVFANGLALLGIRAPEQM